jgi:phosphoribosyl-AMP cyclohydrolase
MDAKEILKEAEKIDYFFDTVNNHSVNKKARDGLFYVVAESTSKPWLFNTQIVTMHPTAEAGMPHTRPPNIIVMPVYYPEKAMETTLKHEYIHIDQRNRRSLWQDAFEREGWMRLDTQEIPKRWEQQCRLNPDTVDQRFWAWKGRHVPLPLFERTDSPELRKILVKWWDMEEGTLQREAPRSFTERYGLSPNQPEHPRELAAVELATFFQNPTDIDRYLNR